MHRVSVNSYGGLARIVGTLAALPLALVACYTPNQERLSTEARMLVPLGAPLPIATMRLQSAHFECRPVGNGILLCSRVRQRLWPSSCVEHIELAVDAATNSVTDVSARPIPCAGL
jgi:hypothetical protein